MFLSIQNGWPDSTLFDTPECQNGCQIFHPSLVLSENLLVVGWRLKVWIDEQHLLNRVVTIFLQLATFSILSSVHPLTVVRVERLGRRRPKRKKVTNRLKRPSLLLSFAKSRVRPITHYKSFWVWCHFYFTTL